MLKRWSNPCTDRKVGGPIPGSSGPESLGTKVPDPTLPLMCHQCVNVCVMGVNVTIE